MGLKDAVGTGVPGNLVLTAKENALNWEAINNYQTDISFGFPGAHLNRHRSSAANLTVGRLGARANLTS